MSNAELAAICAELVTTDSASRFSGACLTDSNTASAQALEPPASPVSWSFQTVAVESEVGAGLAGLEVQASAVLDMWQRDGKAATA